MAGKNILIVDDEVGIRELLSEILYDEGYSVHLAENAAQARQFRSRQQPDLVLLDIWMPDTDGVSLLKEWVADGLLTMPVIMMSGHGTIETAVEATRIGAVDFLEKPVALQKLLTTVAKAIKQDFQKRLPESTAAAVESGVTEGGATTLPLDLPLREARENFERLYFEHHIRKEHGNITHIADKVGLERTHLHRKLKQLGIRVGKKEADPSTE
ncbi:response regulator [Ferriphaselus sp. R-1]|uniref:response regulator n=1 Tax=Ferriphaselus sp. R-1 TaxID=1485544 RepID=UPI0005530E4B|nr:response regulator [Ferriphaselus sp. R-1]